MKINGRCILPFIFTVLMSKNFYGTEPWFIGYLNGRRHLVEFVLCQKVNGMNRQADKVIRIDGHEITQLKKGPSPKDAIRTSCRLGQTSPGRTVAAPTPEKLSFHFSEGTARRVSSLEPLDRRALRRNESNRARPSCSDCNHRDRGRP